MTKLIGLIVVCLLFALISVEPVQADTCGQADVTGDSQVNLSDYDQLKQDFFSSQARSDVNDDGIVDLSDYHILAKFYGSTCNTQTDVPSFPKPPDAITLSPGDDIQQAVNNNPAETTFYLNQGVYRGQKITPKDGNTFIGQKGAVLNGSIVLTNPQDDNGLWYFGGRDEAEDTHGDCRPEFPRCNHSHELFVNNQRLRHVDAKSKVVAGTWFFDYGANRVYLKDDPRGKTVEFSVEDIAINGWNADNVTIQNLIFEKYSTRAQRAAVECNGNNCLLENNEFRLNHAAGFRIGPNSEARYNYSHHNGQMGYGGFAYRDGNEYSGQAVNALYYRNEIAHNNQAGFQIYWEAGGGKVAWNTALTFKENYSHHNIGSGFWSDIDVKDVTYDGNISVFNAKHGIQHEISFDAEVKNNFLAYNSYPYPDFNIEIEGHNQLYIQSSQNVRAFNNTIIVADDFGRGIQISGDSRGDSVIYEPEPWTAKNNQVFNNKIYTKDRDGIVAGMFSYSNNWPNSFEAIESFNNRFYDNDYYLVNTSDRVFMWDDRLDFPGFKNQGQDTNGQVHQATNYPEIPAWNHPVGPR